jgi:hypothetical protein
MCSSLLLGGGSRRPVRLAQHKGAGVVRRESKPGQVDPQASFVIDGVK